MSALEERRSGVEIQYARSVSSAGNPGARKVMFEVFELCDRAWRGIGVIPRSGLTLTNRYRAFDAAQRFGVAAMHAPEPSECHAGEVLRGVMRPNRCPAFGRECTPEHPLGAPMVSSEGACAADFRYGRAGVLQTGAPSDENSS
ncbi:MAG: hypothetical protein QM784_04220 [Polyangiaceae bacterium]